MHPTRHSWGNGGTKSGTPGKACNVLLNGAPFILSSSLIITTHLAWKGPTYRACSGRGEHSPEAAESNAQLDVRFSRKESNVRVFGSNPKAPSCVAAPIRYEKQGCTTSELPSEASRRTCFRIPRKGSEAISRASETKPDSDEAYGVQA
ncbi:hypothetical protein NMY22_g9783 [Coprinellus aureogranulatus]|nr:hypothetical protein NMY22_g9783 [Coprinellus aureogranulatus]